MHAIADHALRRGNGDEAARGRTLRRTSDGLKTKRTHFTINPAAVRGPGTSASAAASSTPSSSSTSASAGTSLAASSSVSSLGQQPVTPQSGRFAFAAPAIDYTEDIGMLAASVAASLSLPSEYSSSAVASTSSGSNLAAAAAALAALKFEAPTRNTSFDTLLPIISSLPDDYAPAFDERRAASLEADEAKLALDYIMLDHGTARLPYTNSRLPALDDGSFQLWGVLHDFRPITEDYAAGYVAGREGAVAAAGGGGGGSGQAFQKAPHPLPAGVAADDTAGPPAQCPAFAASRSAKSLAAIQTVRRVFNWASLPDLPLDLEQTWYGVAFRSARREGSESTNLYEADRKAHEEAVASGGLLMYWYGAPHPVTGENLATCVWTSRADAIAASKLPFHAEAAAHSLPAFRVFDLTRYAVRKIRGQAKVQIDTWSEDDE